MVNTKKVWLVTGSGNGLGRNIIEAVLKTGDIVVATARKTEQLKDLVNRYKEQILVAELDVTNEEQAKQVVEKSVQKFGRIDVLINNAGYGDNRPFEQVPSEDFRKLVETCFFGVVTLTREVLPIMRKQRNGHILQISSLGGRFAGPGNAAYFASKWAVGGFTEGLSYEISPFNVKVTALEPGAMRTNWGKSAYGKELKLISDYEVSVGAAAKSLENLWGNENGDPLKVAQIVIEIVNFEEQLPAHILLGSDAYEMAKQASKKRWEEAEKWKKVSEYTDVENQKPIPELSKL
ncbi:SDR family NAD(P)-dependent oxidoreductase [Mesoflavibacter zeaxanthinifaciens]|uniref:SDR family NAD(P)-dependent oxidoreductase n=1 Tax=Mesoflavibacter zeaxanthinifaciens TaxID=393060 RepID=UPI003A947270